MRIYFFSLPPIIVPNQFHTQAGQASLYLSVLGREGVAHSPLIQAPERFSIQKASGEMGTETPS